MAVTPAHMPTQWDSIIEAIDNHFQHAERTTQTIGGSAPSVFTPITRAATRCVYIDGGNALIFSSPSACVQLVRLAAIEYEGAQRLRTHRTEALCAVTRANDSYSITWSNDWPGLQVDKEQSMTLESAADLARRVAERRYALSFPHLVIFDGDLTSRHKHEQDILDSLPMPHCGLAKTTTRLTDQGASAAAVLHHRGPPFPWLYTLSSTEGFARLHALSHRSFHLDVRGITLPDAAAALAANNDPSFPGYPYGLVEADTLSRVTVMEQRAMQELLRTKLKGRWQEEAATLDAHDVLDAIAGNKNANRFPS